MRRVLGKESICAVPLQIHPMATGARNHSQCDAMLIGNAAAANTYPDIQVCLPKLPAMSSCIVKVLR